MATKTYILENLGCANCANKMEKDINKLKGVSATITFMTQKMVIETENDEIENLEEQIIKLIHKHEPEVVLKARSR